MKKRQESQCVEGKTQMNVKRIDCDLMDWFRGFAQRNKRSVNSEIILLMEKCKKEHEPE